MESQILDTRPMQADRDIRPSHTGVLSSVELVLVRICYVAEVHYSCIIVVLAWEDGRVEIIRMDIGNRVLVGVPSSEA